jgi:hypothetical protein
MHKKPSISDPYAVMPEEEKSATGFVEYSNTDELG